MDDYTRVCDICGKKMTEGYVIDDGAEYFCSDVCMRKRYSDEEYMKMYEQDIAYWTTWEE